MNQQLASNGLDRAQSRPPEIRRTLSLRTRRGLTVLPEPARDLMIPWHDNEELQEQRGSKIRQIITASNTASIGQPRNAAELSVSLVGLVFPYDVRNMQRSLLRLQARMKVVEARVQGDEMATSRVAQGLKTLESEMATIQSVSNMTAQATLPPDVKTRVSEAGTEMLAKAAANANNITNALQAVRSAMSQLSEERTHLLHAKSSLPNNTSDNGMHVNEDVSTASEDEGDLDLHPSQRLGAHDQRDYRTERAHEEHNHQNVAPDKILATSSSRTTETEIVTEAAQYIRGRTKSPRKNAPTSTSALRRPALSLNNRREEQKEIMHRQRISPKQLRQKNIEHRTTENNGVAGLRPKQKHSRRHEFTTYTKNTDARFRDADLDTARDHKNFVWEYIDNMKDKDMSAAVQSFMCDSFPDAVSRSKGRGKPYRQILIHGHVEWPEVLCAIKHMPVPDFLKED